MQTLEGNDARFFTILLYRRVIDVSAANKCQLKVGKQRKFNFALKSPSSHNSRKQSSKPIANIMNNKKLTKFVGQKVYFQQRASQHLPWPQLYLCFTCPLLTSDFLSVSVPSWQLYWLKVCFSPKIHFALPSRKYTSAFCLTCCGPSFAYATEMTPLMAAFV